MTNDDLYLREKVFNSWSNLNELKKLYNYYSIKSYNNEELKLTINKQVEKIKKRISELEFINSIGSSLDGISEKDKTNIKKVFNSFQDKINELQEASLECYSKCSIQIQDTVILTAIDDKKQNIKIRIINSTEKNRQKTINNIHEYPYNHLVSKKLLNNKVGDEIQLNEELKKIWVITEIKKSDYKIIHSIE